jgi:hypothetical protein
MIWIIQQLSSLRSRSPVGVAQLERLATRQNMNLSWLAISLVLVSGVLFWILLSAIHTGQIAFQPKDFSIGYIDRKENPAAFWFLFVGYCLVIAVCMGISIFIWILLAMKPD